MSDITACARYIVLVSDSLGTSHTDECRRYLDENGVSTGEPHWLSENYAVELALGGDDPGDSTLIPGLEAILPGMDMAIVEAQHRRKELLVSDMDSTIIQDETIDLLAAELGLGEKVAAITARAMHGEIDFQDALRERVGLLRGLSERALSEVPGGASLMPGAIEMVKTMRDHGARTILVSGGFDFMTDAIAPTVGFQQARANVLAVADGALTGEVVGDIVDGDTKLAVLGAEMEAIGLVPAQTLAIGDGANDLKMIQASGMGIAYHAKPIVREQAQFHINHTDLRTALYFQGYHDDEMSR